MEEIKVTPKKKKEPVEAVQDEKSVKAPREKKPVKKAKDGACQAASSLL